MSAAPEGPRGGRTWWSRRFIEALESGTEAGRLQRGRGYAGQGAVQSLTVRAGEVTARVQGSRARPYRVSLIVPVLDDDQWATVTAALAGQPLFRAHLLAGELPPEVERVFEVLGLRLFPAGLGDTVLTCSCPDWGHPCKHVAAALYVLADSLDDDPFLLLAWLGRERGAFLSELRRRSRSAPEDPSDEGGDAFGDLPPPAGAAPAPLPVTPEGFWSSSAPPRSVPATRPEPVVWAVDPPEGSAGLVGDLAPLYERLSGGGPAGGPMGSIPADFIEKSPIEPDSAG
ncbi:SWIM zinc finger family protein [Nocardiopsis sediminis]|uniref:SWIM zinc finger family protein n=1 Tax=Nocardiopsis sediminis TaxID=1778267 RepID=A0ABV8FGT7_9ACTN